MMNISFSRVHLKLITPKYRYSDFQFWHLEGPNDLYLFFKEDDRYSLLLAILPQGDPFIDTMSKKGVKVKQKLPLEGIRDGKIFTDQGRVFKGHDYQGYYYMDFFKGKKVLEKRFLYVPSGDYLGHLNIGLIDLGEIEFDQAAFNEKTKKLKNRNKRSAILWYILMSIILLVLFYLTRDFMDRNGDFF
jgi:hypothetical protein